MISSNSMLPSSSSPVPANAVLAAVSKIHVGHLFFGADGSAL